MKRLSMTLSTHRLLLLDPMQAFTQALSHPWNTDDYGLHETFDSAPPMLYVKSLQEQLKTFRSSMPPEVSMRGYMLIHYYHVEQSIYEVGLSRSPVMASLPSHDFRPLELLYACLEANKKFWETLFSIPETEYVYLPMATWSQLSHSAIILQILSSFEHSDWNLTYVRETIDFLTVLDNVILRFGRIEEHFFTRAAARLTSIKAHIQRKWAHSNASGTLGPLLSGDDADFGRTWDPVDLLDESWLGDFLGPMEF